MITIYSPEIMIHENKEFMDIIKRLAKAHDVYLVHEDLFYGGGEACYRYDKDEDKWVFAGGDSMGGNITSLEITFFKDEDVSIEEKEKIRKEIEEVHNRITR